MAILQLAGHSGDEGIEAGEGVTGVRGEGKRGLLRTGILANVLLMSTVELAVKEVKKLSANQARELLVWLSTRQANGTSLKRSLRRTRGKGAARRSMQKLKAWQNSIRFATDWEPARMPDDLVKVAHL